MKVTHLHIFLIGWAYYLGGPVIVSYLGLLDSVELADMWLKYVNKSGPLKWPLLLYTILMPFAFFFGDKLSSLVKRVSPRVSRIRLANWILFPLYALLLLVFGSAASEYLFAGYVKGYDSAIMGPIATVQMMVLFQYILYKSAEIRVAARLNIGLLIVSSVVLLSMGGRLYVASSFAAILFYYWNWVAKDIAARRRALMLVFVMIVALSGLGMLRMGEFHPGLLVFFLFAEPLFTSISAFSIMQGGEWALFDAPKDFFYAFLNIVPSFLWENKALYLSSLEVGAFDVESPFGARSIVVSTVENFGFVGGLIFVAIVGFVMGRSRRNAVSPIEIALYCYMTGLLLFVFFRDPFQIQIKLVITGFLLVWLYRGISALLVPTRILPVSSSMRLGKLDHGD